MSKRFMNKLKEKPSPEDSADRVHLFEQNKEVIDTLAPDAVENDQVILVLDLNDQVARRFFEAIEGAILAEGLEPPQPTPGQIPTAIVAIERQSFMDGYSAMMESETLTADLATLPMHVCAAVVIAKGGTTGMYLDTSTGAFPRCWENN